MLLLLLHCLLVSRILLHKLGEFPSAGAARHERHNHKSVQIHVLLFATSFDLIQ